jgi:hypothetical protein
VAVTSHSSRIVSISSAIANDFFQNSRVGKWRDEESVIQQEVQCTHGRNVTRDYDKVPIRVTPVYLTAVIYRPG